MARYSRALGLAACLATLTGIAPAQTTSPAPPRKLSIANKAWTGDFDKMLERRMIRVYAPFSRSLYFNDKGRERGLAVELVRDWERYINFKYAKQLGKRPLTVYIGPATRDKLLPYVSDGLADVAIELHPAGGHLAERQHRRLVLRRLDEGPGARHQLTGPLRGEQHQGEAVVDEGKAVFDCDAGHALEKPRIGGPPWGANHWT